MAGGALAAAPDGVPAVVLPCGLDWQRAGSFQGFDARPSGTVSDILTFTGRPERFNESCLSG